MNSASYDDERKLYTSYRFLTYTCFIDSEKLNKKTLPVRIAKKGPLYGTTGNSYDTEDGHLHSNSNEIHSLTQK